MAYDLLVNGTTQSVCNQCGTTFLAGALFCKACGGTLRPTISLIPPAAPDTSPKLPTWKRITAGRDTGTVVLLVFSIGALFDFGWAPLEKRSVVEATISAVLGLFGTGYYLLIFWAARKNDPDDPNWPARFVP
jgi:hypothetical protein